MRRAAARWWSTRRPARSASPSATICASPTLYRALSNAGATILSIPAAFTVPTGEAHWHVLLRARAIEAGAFVVAAAQVGSHEDGRVTYGHSLVVDPWGKVLLDMGGEAPGLGFAEIDQAAVEEVRRRLPAHLRTADRSRSRSTSASHDHLRPEMRSARPCLRGLVRLERRISRISMGGAWSPARSAARATSRRRRWRPPSARRATGRKALPPGEVKAMLGAMAEAQRKMLETSRACRPPLRGRGPRHPSRRGGGARDPWPGHAEAGR